MKDIRNAFLLAAAAACLMVLALIEATRALECDIPAGQPCGTDTECECLYGTGD
jgi:hypothetical protein